MAKRYVVGLDFGTESVRGVLADIDSSAVVATKAVAYRHGDVTSHFPTGRRLPAGWALKSAPDYLDATEAIRSNLGCACRVLGIGVDFAASAALPARADGTPLSKIYPDSGHAYAKLWKHRAARRSADRIDAGRHRFLDHDDGWTLGEWNEASSAVSAALANIHRFEGKGKVCHGKACRKTRPDHRCRPRHRSCLCREFRPRGGRGGDRRHR